MDAYCSGYKLLLLFALKNLDLVLILEPGKLDTDLDLAREWPACVVRRFSRLLRRSHACFEAGNNAGGDGLVDARPAGSVGMIGVCHDVLRSCAGRVGRDCEAGHSTFGTQPSFSSGVPRFLSCAVGRGEAGSVKGRRSVPVHGTSPNTPDGFRAALPYKAA
jgi:hypothetical protein